MSWGRRGRHSGWIVPPALPSHTLTHIPGWLLGWRRLTGILPGVSAASHSSISLKDPARSSPAGCGGRGRGRPHPGSEWALCWPEAAPSWAFLLDSQSLADATLAPVGLVGGGCQMKKFTGPQLTPLGEGKRNPFCCATSASGWRSSAVFLFLILFFILPTILRVLPSLLEPLPKLPLLVFLRGGAPPAPPELPALFAWKKGRDEGLRWPPGLALGRGRGEGPPVRRDWVGKVWGEEAGRGGGSEG